MLLGSFRRRNGEDILVASRWYWDRIGPLMGPTCHLDRPGCALKVVQACLPRDGRVVSMAVNELHRNNSWRPSYKQKERPTMATETVYDLRT